MAPMSQAVDEENKNNLDPNMQANNQLNIQVVQGLQNY